MKLGLHLYDFSWPGGASQLGPTLVHIAQAAEAAGFDRISTVDHVWQSPYLGGPEHEVPSCYPTLTYLAAHTVMLQKLLSSSKRIYFYN
jgi:alkanesulfonate monooxygenase SsuD/methylene tetrahydromethanopterin reductase-like flavin-dependent oxidoreductase (luciferase family)